MEVRKTPKAAAMQALTALLCVVLLHTACGKKDSEETAAMGEQRLHHRLQRYYTPLVRPVRMSNISTVIQLAVAPLKLNNVNEDEETIELAVLIREQWHDDMFMWDPDQYGGVGRILVTNHKIWRPEITSTAHHLHSSINHKDVPLKVQWDGLITWQYSAKVKAACKFNLHGFPFDKKHKCSLFLRSLLYDSSQVTLEFLGGEKAADFSQYTSNKNWRLTGVCAKRIKQHDFAIDIDRNGNGSSSNDNMQESFDALRYELHVQRRGAGHHLSTCFLPLVALSCLIPVVFLLPDSKKINVGIALVIAIILLYANLDTHLPASTLGHVPFLDQYYLGIFITSCMACLVATLTTNMGEGSLPSQEPPAWLKKSMRSLLSCVGWITCLRHLSVPNRPAATSTSADMNGVANGCLDDTHVTATTSLTITPSYSSLNSLDKGEHEDTMSLTSHNTARTNTSHKHQQRIAVRKMEWQVIAAIIDRCSFVLFLLIILLLPLILLLLGCFQG